LIYFDEKSKEKVINGLVRHLSTSGLLFVGHSEHLAGISPCLKTIAPTVHALMPASGELLTEDRTPNLASGRAL
jgi:chemotaxis methyl-accepting protein methylase